MNTTSNRTPKGVIYARYSSSGQRDESIEGQLRECRQYAEKFGITIIGEYCDRAMTGTNDKRPEFQRMIRDSGKRLFSVVITWKNDRFARSRYDSAIYKYKLKQNGVRILYAKETIPEGPEGIILESLMEGFAEYYSANLSQNVKRGNYESAIKLQTVGQRVFGLREAADKRFEPDPATAPIVRRIFEEYASGRPAKEIYGDLNAEGYRTSRGNKFTKSSLRSILENEKYIGVYSYADVRDEHGIPAIIEKDLFDRVQKMIDRHHRKPAEKISEDGFLLTAKLFCGECGEPMTGDAGTSRNGSVYKYYICNGRRKKLCKLPRVKKQWIEDEIVARLTEIVTSDEMIRRFADRYDEWLKKSADNVEIEMLNDRLKKTESAIKNVMAAIDAGLITDSIKSHLIELESDRAELIGAIDAARIKSDVAGIGRDAAVWFMQRFRDGDQQHPEWRQYLIDTFLIAAYLYDDGRLILHIKYSDQYAESSLEMVENAVTDGDLLCSNFAPSGAPRRSKVRFAPTSFYAHGKKDVIRPLPCSSFPNHNRLRWVAIWLLAQT